MSANKINKSIASVVFKFNDVQEKTHPVVTTLEELNDDIIEMMLEKQSLCQIVINIKENQFSEKDKQSVNNIADNKQKPPISRIKRPTTPAKRNIPNLRSNNVKKQTVSEKLIKTKNVSSKRRKNTISVENNSNESESSNQWSKLSMKQEIKVEECEDQEMVEIDTNFVENQNGKSESELEVQESKEQENTEISLTKNLSCFECEKKFENDSELSRHLAIHFPKKNYNCRYCGKKFSKPSQLLYHLRTHTGYKPFQCYICNKCFSRKSTLEEHIIWHTKKFPFYCEKCGRGFIRLTRLEAHSVVHNPRRDHTCPICGNKFAYMHSMREHIVKHKAFFSKTCPICKITVTGSRSLEEHQMKHSNEEGVFDCAFCGQFFSNTEELVDHCHKTLSSHGICSKS